MLYRLKIDLISEGLRYLTEEISRSTVEYAAWVLFSDCNTMQEKRVKLRKELLRQKKPALDVLRNLQPIQVTKIAYVGSFTVTKAFSGEKAKVRLDNL